MRFLIDGYNLMHALGLMARSFGPDGLHRARHRFLTDLAAALGPDRAAATCVVFDAARPPEGRPSTTRHKGLSIVFASSDDEADDCLERLIKSEGVPRRLTVVSSDRRIRVAATRRRALAIGSEEFWSALEDEMKRRPRPPEAPPADRPATDADGADWAAVFADAAPEVEQLRPPGFVPTDDELARIEREEGTTLDPRRLRRR